MKARHIFKFQMWAWVLLAFMLVAAMPSVAGTLLPNAKQQFIDGNGNPLAGGQVYFYVPGTTTPKNTYQDSGQTILNANPLTLDGNGYAVIYGTGAYRQVLKDSLGNTIWDQLTADTSSSQTSWAGTATGTANQITVTAVSFSSQDGQTIVFRAAATNTGPTTFNAGSGFLSVVRPLAGGQGIIPLVGGEISAGAICTVIYDAVNGNFQLISVVNTDNSPKTVAGAATVNLGAVQSNVVKITGSGANISSFGTYPAGFSPIVHVTFADVNTIIYNATSLITPTATNITTAAGDSAILAYQGSGNWQILSFVRSASGYGQPYAHNVLIKNNVVAATQLDVTASSATLTTNGVGYAVGSLSLTINATTLGANGIDTGALAAGWYAVYLIYNPATATTAGIISTNFTTPSFTNAAGYGYPLRIGAFLVDGGGSFYRIRQKGQRAQYVVTAATNTAAMPIVSNAAEGVVTAPPTWQPKTATNWVPSTARSIVLVANTNAGANIVMAAPNNQYGAFNSATNAPPLMSIVNGTGSVQGELVLESSSFYVANNSAGGSVLYVTGWVDQVSVD